jgi:small subunit ribosomal protein S9
VNETTRQHYGTGRRKTATARVYLRPGSGQIRVNARPVDEYIRSDVQKMIVRHPLVLTETADKLDVLVRVRGGGPTGQAGAMRHGIARALVEYNPELRGKLKAAGLLTRDPREVERKKYGRPGARKRFQFSKR